MSIVNKEDTTIHSDLKLLACIRIAFGLFNFKRMRGHLRGEPI